MDKETPEEHRYEWPDAVKAKFDVKTLNIIGDLDKRVHTKPTGNSANQSVSKEQFNG